MCDIIRVCGYNARVNTFSVRGREMRREGGGRERKKEGSREGECV